MNELLTQLIDRNQVKELRELRQTISSRENNTVCQYGQDIARVTDDKASPLISPVSSSSECHSPFDGEDAASDNAKEIGHLEGERNQEGAQNEVNVAPVITGISLQAIVTPVNQPGYSAWDVVFNDNTTAALNLNLVHNLKQEGRSRVIFIMDGKYLATGIVSIFEDWGKNHALVSSFTCFLYSILTVTICQCYEKPISC